MLLDYIPTLHVLPPIHYYLGRVAEGLKNTRAVDAYERFLSLKAKGDGELGLVADASRRVTGR